MFKVLAITRKQNFPSKQANVYGTSAALVHKNQSEKEVPFRLRPFSF